MNKWQFPEHSNLRRKRVSKGTGLHDVGKPPKFSIKIEFKNGKPQLTYSFSGHRFVAECSYDPWVEKLARGHHDYSVHDICRDTYILKSMINQIDETNPLWKVAKTYYQDLSLNPLTYAQELYILEMCDQIEAEIACRFYEDDQQAESRAFMNFNITHDVKNKNLFYIDPWNFDDNEIELTLATWSMPLTQEVRDKIENSLPEDKQKISQELQLDVKKWWESQPKNLQATKSKVILKPLLNEKIRKVDATQLYQKFREFTPNPMQQDLISVLNPESNPNPSYILKAPTGTGKLEAVLIPSLAYDYKLILVLPTKSLLEDHRQRIESYLVQFSALSVNQGRDLSLVIDTGTQMTRYIFRNGERKQPKNNPRRHLYKGNIILTTLDKFMYRYFGYGDKQKSFIFPYRINQDNTLICFDEAHSYDSISFTNFCGLVKALYEAGRSLILMTATLPEKQLERFDYLREDIIDYIDNGENLKNLNIFLEQKLKQPFTNQKQFKWIQDIDYDIKSPDSFQGAFTKIILNNWQSNPKQRIIAIVETVKDAVAIYQNLKRILEIKNNEQQRFLFLYHGRIPDIPKDSEFSRTSIYQQIKDRDENNRPYIVVTTSAIEVGCDLNSTLLITQMCNPENLIQRAGRCNRKGDIPNSQIIVIGNSIPEFTNSLNDDEFEQYKTVLDTLNGKKFDATLLMNCVSTQQQVDDYRVVELFSMLHDYVYKADLTCQPSHEKGLVITRSWTPSVTLVYDDGETDINRDLEKRISTLPQITIAVDRLIFKEDKDTGETNKYNNVDVYEYIYNKEETRWKLDPLKYWGQAYKKDIVIIINKEHNGAIHGTSKTYEYVPELGFVKLPGVFIKWKPIGNEERLQYKTKEDKSVVITYIKALSND
ncbi:CRISPR-associated helicase Cas3' [Cyanothece sp. BG0011]|uniref:CRISPR-associated helicase Cas3' n=1 Tax=Cyanothece sp. BG0011 TaxID=2082950 RepID=UPI0018E5A877|nr:CRISPR-associated helicase Cas3' [Cyanothece sp. BG0011]